MAWIPKGVQADGVQPIVAPGQSLFGSNGHTITSSSDILVDTNTHVMTIKKSVKTSSITFNDGTVLSSTNGIVGLSLWGSISGNINNQADLIAKFNAVGVSTSAMQTQINGLVVSTTSLGASVASLGVSTTTLGNTVAILGISTTALQAQVTINTASIATLNTSTIAIQNVVNSHTTALAALAVSTTSLQVQINGLPTLSGANVWSGQNQWTSVQPSTFTGQVVAGGLTANDLSISSFVVTNGSHKLVSFDLFNTLNYWNNQQNFLSPLGTGFQYWISAASMTLTALPGIGPLRGGPSTIISTGPVNLASEVTGNLGVTNLDSGTNADASHFWAGSGHWLTIPGSSGASSLAISTGIPGADTIVSSPTIKLLVDNRVLTGQLIGSTTFFLSVNYSSVTAQGNTFNIANKLVQLTNGTQYPAVNGNLITNLNYINVTGAPSAYVPYGTSAGLTSSAHFQFDGSTLSVTGNAVFYHSQIIPAQAGGPTIFNTNYAGPFYNTLGFADGPIPYDVKNSTAFYNWGVQQFGSVNKNLPTFGLWDFGGVWLGGWDTGDATTNGFEIGTSVGSNKFDVAGNAMIGFGFTTSGRNTCGIGSNQPCGAIAPANGMAIQGDTLLGTVTEIAGNAQFQVSASTSDKYALYISTPNGTWVVSIDTTSATVVIPRILATTSGAGQPSIIQSTVKPFLVIDENQSNAPQGEIDFTTLFSTNVALLDDGTGFHIQVSTQSNAAFTTDRIVISRGTTPTITMNPTGGVVVFGDAIQFQQKTIAQLHALAPSAAYQEFGCTDCTVDTVAYSTGTAAGAWAEGGSKTTFPH